MTHISMANYRRLWKAMADQGCLVKCTMTITIHFTDATWSNNKNRLHAECFENFKTVLMLHGTCRYVQNLAGGCKIHLRLSQISAGILPILFLL